MDLTIRDATAADAVAVAGLLRQLGYRATAEQVTRRLERLRSDPRWRLFLAVDAAGVVGLAAAEVIPVLEHDEPVCRLAALVVDARSRGRGAGATLAGAVEDFARERGCSAVMLTTNRSRVAAHAFYRRLGYAETGLRFIKPLD